MFGRSPKGNIVMREEIIIHGKMHAIILYAAYDERGIQFFTPHNFSQQLASISYSAGRVIPAHTHTLVSREVLFTQETLFIRKGKLRVDFYSDQQEYCKSRVLGPGDVILLVSGGHGFEVIEDLNMVEVKQGPYIGDADKIAVASKPPDKLIYD